MNLAARLLNSIERIGNRLPDPVFLFLWLILGLVALSLVGAGLGWSAVNPVTGETMAAQSLLSRENLEKLIIGMPRTLADFPPLNHCCYPAVSEQYVVPRENPWVPSAEAHQVMQELAATVEDKKLLRCLKFYQKHPWKRSAKKIAGMLQEKRHAEVTDLLMEELKMAAANYPRRKFTDEEENQNRKTEKRASERKRELEEQGFRINIFREEPFIASRDSIQYKISLMIWEKKGKKRKVQIEEFSADRRG